MLTCQHVVEYDYITFEYHNGYRCVTVGHCVKCHTQICIEGGLMARKPSIRALDPGFFETSHVSTPSDKP